MTLFRFIPPRAKRFVIDWVLPPALFAAYRRWRTPDIQKFWSGAPVTAPPAEARYFASGGLASATLTHRDDSRACGRVERAARLPLPSASAGEAVQFAVVADSEWPRTAKISVTVGGRTMTHVGLSDDRWLDLRLDVPAGTTHLDITTDAPVHVSFPRAVRVASVAPGSVRHIIVLVLDGWTTRLSTERHPTEPNTPLTPNFDRFFADGFEASHGYASGEWTLPAAASFFTGLCTARHRAFHPYDRTYLPTDRALLAERFQAAGYHTLCMSTGNRLTPAYGHHRGFDRFIYHWPYPGFTRLDYDPAVWLADLIGQLAAHRRDCTFSYVHLPDTHPPWNVPPLTRSFNLGRRGSSAGLDLVRVADGPAAAEDGRQLYCLRLHEIDRMLGSVFDYIERNIADETLVILTADHGTPWQYLRERRPADEPYLVDDRVAVSLRMRGPGVAKAHMTGLTAPNLDLMPTVLARVGLEVPGDLDGRDLLDPGYRRDVVISESFYGGVYEIAVRDGRRAYFEKYGLDERAVRVAGLPIYRALFTAGASDYSHPLAEPPGCLAGVVQAHLTRVGLNRVAA